MQMKHNIGQNVTEDSHFAAANSGKGFVSFYPEIFDAEGIRRKYIIKGGPGTGKSSFMRTVAKYAEEQGREVTLYYCSSDPESLDGVVIDGKIAILDGTAPHSMDADLPGVKDEIVNLGVFWDSDALAKQYNEITSLCNLKSECYRRAYRYLAACFEIREADRSLIMPALKQSKMERAAQRILREVPKGEKFSLIPGFSDSVGMRGRVRIGTYEKQARKLYVVEDYYRIAPFFLCSLAEEAKKKEIRVCVSYHPVHTDEIDTLYFPDSGECFVTKTPEEAEALTVEAGCETVFLNMKRFADAEEIRKIRSQYRENRKMYEALLDSACDSLKEAGDYHFRLEKIYISCMDFETESRFAHSFCQKILS